MGNKFTDDEIKQQESGRAAIIQSLSSIKSKLNLPSTATDYATIRDNMIYRFNRFLIAYPDTYLSKSFGHIFFTRPNLNIYGNRDDARILSDSLKNDPTFTYIHKNEPVLLRSLTSKLNSTHDFNPFLSNKAESFDAKDESIKTMDYGETYTGYKLKYGKNKIESVTADEISIQFTEDDNYRVYKIHKAWVDYISKVYRGEIKASDSSIRDRELDYAASIYYFLCGPDGETILYWSKYTGVFPVNIPSSEAAWQKGDVGNSERVSISYSYAWKEDFNPIILQEFNINAGVGNTITPTTGFLPIYDKDVIGTGRSFSGAPFILQVGNEYKLKFRNSL